MRVFRGIGAALLLTAALAGGPARAADPELSLSEAVRQALDANLDLAFRRRALQADRQEIGLARSALLPQVDFGTRAQILDSERSDSERGNNTKESVLLGAKLTQVLYDESDWAGFDIQKQVYAAQVEELESFRLGVVEDAASTFLDLDRARATLVIQQRNRELTLRNRETSRARIAAGWSSEREVLRWDSQLAGNDGDVRAAQVQILQARFELNRVRNQPPETPAAPLPATIGEYGFVYAREPIARAIEVPEDDRQLRDFLVQIGIARSPDLAALDASIAAAERQLIATGRAFWVPSLSLALGVDHLVSGGSGSANDFNETEWGAAALLTFPIFEGGAKFAGRAQARETLASLRTQRRAVALSLEQTIRAAFAQASGAYDGVDYARRQVEAARRNFELVDASYVLGVDSILDMLDAQSQLLDGELGYVNALYGFLEALIVAETEIAFFPFLEAPAEVESLLDGLEGELGIQP